MSFDPSTTTTPVSNQRPSIILPSSSLQYVVAIVVMFIIGSVFCVLLLKLRPLMDPVVVISVVFSLITPTTLSLMGFLKAQETHASVNGRLDNFMINARAAAHAVGVVEGQLQQQKIELENKKAAADAAAAAALSAASAVKTAKIVDQLEK